MTPTTLPTPKPRLLLTAVFGPYAVDDAYGRSENKMELFHNQVTREQGVFSYRFHHHSYGLYMLAENLQVPTTVLDFPKFADFEKELANGQYTHVGISFIVPNFAKAKRMAEYVRARYPKTQIILGGHGVNIPNIEKMIPCDAICRGDGISFLRKYFGERTDRPVKHPIMHSSFDRKVLGVPLPRTSGVIIPGVGCPNRCRFCCTTHFFGDYTGFLNTGREIFDVCQEYERKLGVTDFGVLDENFLKKPERARELVALMEEHDKYYTFAIFSSAETLTGLGDLDLLVRMGVQFVWIGMESRREAYEKNKGVDFHWLVRSLRVRGISVMASAILFLEHHDHVTLWEDADFAISVNPDYLQFMQLGPMPGTKLYEDYERQGRILENIPYEEKHGQDQIWFRHDIFSREESREILRAAFRRDYETNGASFLRAAMTTLMGVRYCRNHADARVRRREKSFVLAGDLRLLMVSSRILSENDATTELVDRIEREYEDLYGVPTWGIRAKQAAAVVFGLIEWARIRTVGDTRQPGMQVMRYGWKLRRVRAPYRWVRAAFRWVRGLSGLRDSAVTAGAE